MSAGTIVLVVVLILLFGGFGWHYGGPVYGGGISLGTVLIVLLILVLLGRL